MSKRLFSAFGVPYVPESHFLDVQHVVEVVCMHFAQFLTIVRTNDEITGKTRTVLERVFEKPVNFDLAFANKLTYRAGDATAGWLNDLEPLFALYRSIVKRGLYPYTLRKNADSDI